ncbi:BspA-like protein [Candidatus Malacoplasma girerdii]|uniref:BspA-like protein n=1 Tax=Candidatus Malacoplasma girerdii TaxID=1318617 RepID=A0A097ST33_9BACT|nr:BspA-like protein [Candidatus Malacoplasma girerdii]
MVISNPHTHTHSSLIVESKATNDISWTIDDSGNISPADKTQIKGAIEIPSVWDGIPVTGIARFAFKDCTLLTNITFAEGIKLTSIAIGTFQDCSSLTNINIPSSVTSIGDDAFADCSSLKSVNFDNGSKLTSIGIHAFKNCNTLTSINIPDSVTSIGESAFDSCSALTDVTFNWNEEQLNKLQLDNSLFINYTSSQTISFHIPWGTKDQYNAKFTQDILGTNITAKWISYIQWSITDDGLISPADKGQIQGEITIPDTVNGKTVTGIANSAFDSCSALTSITIPSGVTSIDVYAFRHCSSLVSVTFAEDSQLTSTGYNAFLDCSSLTSINIPNSVTFISSYTFKGCSSLISINIPSSVTSIGESAFDSCSSLTTINFDVNSRLTNIGNYAFQKCTSLTSINIPSSVTSIGSWAFADCSSLTDVTFNWNEEQLNKLQLDNSLFINHTSSQTIIFYIPLGTKDQYKAKFTQDILGTNITANWISYIQWSITDDGFISPANKDLIKGDVTIPDTVSGKVVTGIAREAFSGCTSLTSINIPNNVTSIGGEAFRGCNSLVSVNFAESSQLTDIDNFAFSGCSSLKNITIPNSATIIRGYAFQNCSALTSIVFTKNSQLNSIGDSAFSRCSALTSINIPSGVTSIGEATFVSCGSLKNINISSSVTNIGNSAFDSCSSLTSVNFAEDSQLTDIDNFAFSGCSSLKNITIPNSVTSVGIQVFSGCSSLSSVDIPSTITSIGDNAFYGCPLTNIEFTGNQTYDWVPTAEGGNTVGGYIIQKGNDLSINKVVGCLAYGKIDIKPTSIPNNNISNWAFGGCAGITLVIVPSNVTSIGESAFEDCDKLTDVYLNWDENQIKKLQIDDYVFDSTTKKITINFHIPKGMKELYIAKTKGWFNGSAVPNWIENNPPAPSSNSNLPLILGLTFGFIILIGIGSYLGYRYYKHRKNSKK